MANTQCCAGNRTGYKAHTSRREEACEPSKKAQRDYMRGYMRELRAARRRAGLR